MRLSAEFFGEYSKWKRQKFRRLGHTSTEAGADVAGEDPYSGERTTAAWLILPQIVDAKRRYESTKPPAKAGKELLPKMT